jgi:hypothetical protein
VTGEVQAFLAGRVVRMAPASRVVTIGLRPVGQGRSYRGAYVGAAGQLAPVLLAEPGHRQVGRVIKVDPLAAGGAELDLIVGDDDAWHSLAAGTAKIDALVAFSGSSGGDPVGGRPLRIEIG